MARGNNVLEIIINGTNRAGPAFQKVGTQAARMGTIVGTALIGATYRAGQFEKGLAEISTLLDGDVTPAIAATREELLGLSMASGQAIGKLTKAKYDVISAGFTSAAASAEVLDAATRLATAGLTDVAASADLVTSALGGFQLSAKESDRIVDVLFQTVRKGKTTLTELAQGYGKVFSTAKVAGVGIEALSAAMATATAQGVNTREAITGLNALLLALAAPAEEAKEALAEAGITMEKGFLAALQAVNKAAGDSPAKLRELIPSIEALRVAAAVAGDIDLMTQNMWEMDNATGVVDDGVEKMAKTFDYQLNRAKRAVDALTIQIGTALLPKATEMIQKFSDLVGAIARNDQKIKDITITVAKWAAGLTAAGAALTTLSMTMQVVGPFITMMGVGFAGMTLPIKAAVIAIAGLVVILIKYRNEIEQKLFPMAQKFNQEQDKTPGIIDKTNTKLKQLASRAAGEKLKEISTQFKLLAMYGERMSTGFNMRALLNPIWEVAGATDSLSQELIELSGNAEKIDTALSGGFEAAGDTVTNIMDGIIADVSGMFDELIATSQAKFDAIIRSAKKAEDIVVVRSAPEDEKKPLGPEKPDGILSPTERRIEAEKELNKKIKERQAAEKEAIDETNKHYEELQAHLQSLAVVITEDFVDLAFFVGSQFANMFSQISRGMLGLTQGSINFGMIFKQMIASVIAYVMQLIARLLVAKALLSAISFGIFGGGTEVADNLGQLPTGIFAHGGTVRRAAYGAAIAGIGSDFPPVILPGSPGMDRTPVLARGGEMMISPERVRATQTLLNKVQTSPKRRLGRESRRGGRVDINLQANRPFRREEQIELTDSVEEGFQRSSRHRS